MMSNKREYSEQLENMDPPQQTDADACTHHRASLWTRSWYPVWKHAVNSKEPS
jgi:hypothetical protein